MSSPGAWPRRTLWIVLLSVALGCGHSAPQSVSDAPSPRSSPPQVSSDTIHVRAGEDIQEAIDTAASLAGVNRVVVHQGIYRPRKVSQALIRIHARHDGIVLEANGNVTLSAANPNLARRTSASFPAVVNHVVYFGDGITNKTTLRGFRIADANGFVTNDESDGAIEPNSTQPRLTKQLFFYMDGGAIKIFGRSWPTLENLVCEDNTTALCGGAVSIENRGFLDGWVRIRHCVFRNNRCPATGSAVDVLEGSSVIIENCLFHANIGNTGMDEISRTYGLTHNLLHGSGALTVFPNSRATVTRCTFAGNWNGADDAGKESRYSSCIFWKNDASDGSRPGNPYDLDIENGQSVIDCVFSTGVRDRNRTVSAARNSVEASDPEFDSAFVPQNAVYSNVGFRPQASQPDFVTQPRTVEP